MDRAWGSGEDLAVEPAERSVLYGNVKGFSLVES
jgi:hypothetical protein